MISADNVKAAAMLGVIGLGALLAYKTYKTVTGGTQAASNAAAAVVDGVKAGAWAVNPLNNDNIFYSGVNGAGAWVSGDSDWTLGGSTYDFFHDTPADQIGAAAVDLNPNDSRNLINRGVTATGAYVSGDSSWTLGGWLYDLTHKDPLDPKQNTYTGEW